MSVKRGALSDQRGITLVELMVASAVLGMVVLVASSLYAFGASTFRLGESQAWLQANMDTALRSIVSRVRNATELQVMTNTPGAFDSGWYYIYLKDPSAETTSVQLRSPGGSAVAITDDLVQGEDGLRFHARLVEDDILLDISLQGSYRSRTRQSSVTILLGNLTSLPPNTSGAAVRFRLPG